MKIFPILFLLAGCKTVVYEPVEVKVPYPVRCTYTKVIPARCYYPCEVQKFTPIDIKTWAIIQTLKSTQAEVKELRAALSICGDAE